jgi:hypothetical protein
MQQIQVDLNQCAYEFCECGCPYYEPRNIIKKISAIMAGATTPQYSVITFQACKKCGKPHTSTMFNIPRMKTPEEVAKEKDASLVIKLTPNPD